MAQIDKDAKYFTNEFSKLNVFTGKNTFHSVSFLEVMCKDFKIVNTQHKQFSASHAYCF